MSTTARTNDNQNNGNPAKGRKRRRVLIGLGATGAAAALVLGTGFAFFGDVLTVNTAATAGRLDINGNMTVLVNGVEDADGVVENLNPGDVVRITGTVSNVGNKSAWIRSVVSVDPADADIGNYLYVWHEDAPNKATLNATDRDDLVATLDGTQVGTGLTAGGSAPEILNGTGDNAETEIGGSPTYTVDAALYLAKEAPNAAQGKMVDAAVDVQAMQYRNNPSPTWTDVATAPVQAN